MPKEIKGTIFVSSGKYVREGRCSCGQMTTQEYILSARQNHDELKAMLEQIPPVCNTCLHSQIEIGRANLAAETRRHANEAQ